ncbi:MAG TPA: DUF559 domain-containing protein [Acidimicrobiales bacterium]
MRRSETTKSPQLRLVRIAAGQWGVATLAQAVGCGVHHDTMQSWARQGKIERLRSGIYALPGFPGCFEQRLLACVLAGGPRTVASHHSAARLYGLDGFDRTSELHVLTPRGVRVKGARAHQTPDLARHDRQTVSGIPATSPTRTLVDLADVVDRVELEQALECALRRHLTTVAFATRRAAALTRRGARGPYLLGLLLARRGDVPATSSMAETVFLQLVRAAGLAEPVRQHPVGRRLLDFAWPPARVAVEIDGGEAHVGRAALDRDLVRQNAIVLEGWRILRYSATRVLDHRLHPQILTELAATLERAA